MIKNKITGQWMKRKSGRSSTRKIWTNDYKAADMWGYKHWAVHAIKTNKHRIKDEVEIIKFELVELT